MMKISYKVKQKGVMTLLLDEEPWRDIHNSIFGRRPPFPRQVNSQDEWNEIFQAAEYAGALKFVMRRLSMRNHLGTELAGKLKDCLVSDKIIEKTLVECTRLGYLDDNVTLQAYVQSLLRKGYGPRAILPKLLRKQIPYQQACELIEQLDEKVHVQRICHLLETKYRSKKLEEFSDRQKTIASLMRKGFSLNDIKQAFDLTKAH
jgi:regulatory protein